MKQNYYLVVKCIPLNEQYETEAAREPLCITADLVSYEGSGESGYHERYSRDVAFTGYL